MKKLLFVFSIFLIYTTSSQAQDTLVKGQLFDASANNEPITFGNVTIKETKQSVSTDFRGNYFFENLNPGTYTLEFAFLGYKTYTSKIIVAGNGTQKLDAYLKPSQAINFDEITLASLPNN